MASGFTPRDILAGQLAALIPGLSQPAMETAADGLVGLGYRRALDPERTLEILSAHSFMEEDEGDGWTEPQTNWYCCSCTKAIYAQWTQKDPGLTGLTEFRDEGRDEGREDAMALHHAHVAGALAGADPDSNSYALTRVQAAATEINASLVRLDTETTDLEVPMNLLADPDQIIFDNHLRYGAPDPGSPGT